MSSAPDLRALTPRVVIKRLLAIVRRTLLYWPVLVVAATFGVGAFILVPKVMPPVYESSTVLLYQQGIEADTLLGSRATATESRRSRNMRLREMLLSRSNLTPIIEEHELFKDTVESRGMVEALQEMRNQTRCRVQEGDTISISYQGDSADEVHEVTKSLADSMVEQARKYKAQQADNTAAFLKAQLDTTRKDLQLQENKLATFLAEHPEFALESPAQLTAAGAAIRAETRDVGAATQPVAAPRPTNPIQVLERQAARLEARIKEAENPTLPPPTPAPVAPPRLDPESERAISAAERAVAAARDNLADKQARFTAKHPDVVAAQQRLNSAIAKLNKAKAEAKTLEPEPAPTPAPATTPADVDKLRKELASVRSALTRARRNSAGKTEDAPVVADAETTTESNSIVALETTWTTLNREVAAARERFEHVERQLFRADIIRKVETSGGGSQVRVLDEAYLPKRPSRRGPRRTGAVGFMAMMVLGGLLALALAFLDDRVYDDIDLKNLELGPIAHVVPKYTGRGK